MLESELEHTVNRKAETAGLIQVKIDGRGRRGWPDRMYLYKGHVCFVEFKLPGEKPTVLQEHIHGILRTNGFEVWIIDNADIGLVTLLKWKRHVDLKLA